jgi:hypothetical protein
VGINARADFLDNSRRRGLMRQLGRVILVALVIGAMAFPAASVYAADPPANSYNSETKTLTIGEIPGGSDFAATVTAVLSGAGAQPTDVTTLIVNNNTLLDNAALVSIPATLTNATVINLTQARVANNTIPDEWMQNNSTVTEIDLPNSITTIGAYAFNHTESLKKFAFPAELTSIGAYAFADSTFNGGDYDVALPEGFTTLGEGAFDNCDLLIGFTIPSTLTSLPKKAFSNCDALNNIHFPATFKSIGEQAFAGVGGAFWVLYFETETIDVEVGPQAFGGVGPDGFIYVPAMDSAEDAERVFASYHAWQDNYQDALFGVADWEVLSQLIVAGKVTDGDTGVPIGQVMIQIADPVTGQGLDMRVTAADGTYLFTKDDGTGLIYSENLLVSATCIDSTRNYADIEPYVVDFTHNLYDFDLKLKRTKSYPTIKDFGSWKGSGTASATVDADDTLFEVLSLNGEIIDAANYTHTSGSSIITLSEDYLSGFADGSYTFFASYSDGNSEPLTLDVSHPGPLPPTSDNFATPAAAGAALALLGVLALCCTPQTIATYRRRKTF